MMEVQSKHLRRENSAPREGNRQDGGIGAAEQIRIGKRTVYSYILQLCVQYDAVQIVGNSCGIRRTLGKDETKGFEI